MKESCNVFLIPEISNHNQKWKKKFMFSAPPRVVPVVACTVLFWWNSMQSDSLLGLQLLTRFTSLDPPMYYPSVWAGDCRVLMHAMGLWLLATVCWSYRVMCSRTTLLLQNMVHMKWVMLICFVSVGPVLLWQKRWTSSSVLDSSEFIAVDSAQWVQNNFKSVKQMKDMAMSKGGLCSNGRVIMDIKTLWDIVDSFGIVSKSTIPLMNLWPGFSVRHLVLKCLNVLGMTFEYVGRLVCLNKIILVKTNCLEFALMGLYGHSWNLFTCVWNLAHYWAICPCLQLLGCTAMMKSLSNPIHDGCLWYTGIIKESRLLSLVDPGLWICNLCFSCFMSRYIWVWSKYQDFFVNCCCALVVWLCG